MPAKKLSSSTPTSAAAPSGATVRPRARPSTAVLNSSIAGSEGSGGTASPHAVSIAAASVVRRPLSTATRGRTAVKSTSIAAQQQHQQQHATALGSSSSVLSPSTTLSSSIGNGSSGGSKPHGSASTGGVKSATALRPRAAATTAASSAPAAQPTPCPSPPPPPPASSAPTTTAAPVQHTAPAPTAGTVLRRPRTTTATAAPAPAPPPPPTEPAATAPSAVPPTDANGSRHSLGVSGAKLVSCAAATPAAAAPAAAANHATETTTAALVAAPHASRHRTHAAPPASAAGRPRAAVEHGAPAPAPAEAAAPAPPPDASLSSVTAGSMKSASLSSGPGAGKKKIVRRAAPTVASTRPSSTAGTSRRPSTGGAADHTATSTRDPSVAPPPPSIPPLAIQPESAPSTALNTARTIDPTNASTPTNAHGGASASAAVRRSRGPVVSEEWARSIIKPGDEQLLYRPVTGAPAAGGAFARTPSGTGLGGAGDARQSGKGRASPYESQLRRAQQTVLQRRHSQTPGRHSAVVGSVAPSIASGGSDSRFGSTVKRSGTRMQHRAGDAEERQGSLTGAMAAGTPTGGDGGGEGGAAGRLSHAGSAAGGASASPTPSRMSEASTNTTAMGGAGGAGRLSGGSGTGGGAPRPLEQLPGGASVAAAQRRSPSLTLTLFAKPSPRTYSTPSPRGSTGVPMLRTPFGVSSGPYYAGNEELTRLTRVREEMLRSLMQAAAAAAAEGSSQASSPSSAAARPLPPPAAEEAGAAATTAGLEMSASSLLTMHSDPQVGEMTLAAPTSPPGGKRPRQRVYGVGLRGGSGGVASSDEPAPAADVTQPRGRGAGGGSGAGILASSMRQKPAPGTAVAAVSPARKVAASGASSSTSIPSTGAAGEPVPSTASARPTLDSSAIAAHELGAARQPRRPAVAVALSSLQSTKAIAERMRLELARQDLTQHTRSISAAKAPVPRPSSTPATSAATTRGGAAARTAAATAPETAAQLDDATRRLLLDPLFPLLSEENYQRLVLKNDEYTTRKSLLDRFGALTPRLTLLTPRDGSPTPRPPRASRALDMDLAEADEPAPVRPLTESVLRSAQAASAAAALAPGPGQRSATASPANAAASCSTPPRPPAVQYGGPALYTTFSPPRAPSPTAAAASAAVGSSAVMEGTVSPAREGKLLVNAVMPSERTGPIKPLPASGVWYERPSVAGASPASDGAFSGTAQPPLSVSLLASSLVGSGTGTSPIRGRSPSPTPSAFSSHNVTRRSSLLRGVHTAPQPQPHLLASSTTAAAATATVASSRSVSADDEESTASDEAVDLAEGELGKALPRWGPFRAAVAAAAAAPPSAAEPRPKKAASKTSAALAAVRRAASKKPATSASNPTTPSSSAASSTTQMDAAASVVPPAMLEELQAYVHLFLKRYRAADTATAEEMGPVPETPLTLQRAIRQSLRLCSGTAVAGQGDSDDAAAAELQDPLDDGSYHSQNVQYVLDLLGSLLQMEASFSEEGASASSSMATVSRSGRHITEAELVSAVMHQSPAAEAAAVTRRRRKSTGAARPVLRLPNPELCAVELMFAGGAAAESPGSVGQSPPS